MAWTAPRDWTVGETVTEDMMDEQVKGNLRYLKGMDGAPTIESGLVIDNTDGDEYVKLPLLSTAECSTVLNAEGEVAFDEQTHQMKAYDGTAIRAMISEADVDDTPVNGADTVPVSSNWAYDHLNILTTAGDMIYATGARTWTRLAASAGKYLYNDGTDLSWVAGTIPQYVIVIWTGTIANIPAGYVICDGNNSSPNLLTRFIEGVATAATNPGATGGNTSHAHSISVGSRDLSGTGSPNTETTSTGSTDGRPLFYDVAFIMKS